MGAAASLEPSSANANDLIQALNEVNKEVQAAGKSGDKAKAAALAKRLSEMTAVTQKLCKEASRNKVLNDITNSEPRVRSPECSKRNTTPWFSS